jgi:hypothetical protein
LKIQEPLKKLFDENAFDEEFQSKIPTEDMFDSMREILWPLTMIKRESYKLQSDEIPTIQHAITALIELGNLANVPVAK